MEITKPAFRSGYLESSNRAFLEVAKELSRDVFHRAPFSSPDDARKAIKTAINVLDEYFLAQDEYVHGNSSQQWRAIGDLRFALSKLAAITLRAMIDIATEESSVSVKCLDCGQPVPYGSSCENCGLGNDI